MDKESIALSIVERLRKAGHQAYFAGGCVRDRIRGVEPKDFDIATSALTGDIQSLFAHTIPVGIQFGVILVLENEIQFEIATFRSEGEYRDGRHPSKVTFTTVEEDAKRRDFTVNGLFWDPQNQNEILDFVDGQRDIKNKIIRTIGVADERFAEDHLRMLRAVRFAVQLGYQIEEQTFDSIKRLSANIAKVSQERIRDELIKILTSEAPAVGIRLLDEAGLLPYILPEVITMKGVEQPIQYHPEGDVFIHTMMLLEGIKNAPIELAMGALLHDVAKPATFVRAPDRIRFHGHDKLGAEMSHKILKRLAFPNHQIEIICSLVNEHLRFKDVFQMRLSTLKRFLALDRFDLHLALHYLDCTASHGNLDAYEFCKAKVKEFAALPPPPSKIITGADLVTLGFKPGKQFSEILTAVEDAVLEGNVNSKDEAIALVLANFGEKLNDVG
jgi:putative nucleotidyltransferase with HDIG domain